MELMIWAALCPLLPAFAAVGYWTPVATPFAAPAGTLPNLMLLLTDGTVMIAGQPAGDYGGNTWYRLTPDTNGSYINGAWTTLQSMNYSRLYYASQILKDGRVFVAGGEYNSDGADGFPAGGTAEVFDPTANSGSGQWTDVSPPPGFQSYTPPNAPPNTIPDELIFCDANSELLPNGDVLLAPAYHIRGTNILIYDPVSNIWSGGPFFYGSATNLGSLDELTWVKLPDNSIVMVDQNTTNSSRYIPATDSSTNFWLQDADLPVEIWDIEHEEIGPGFLLPDGRGFFIGGNGHTAYYTPSGTTNNGVWTRGPDIPGALVAADAPGAMMVNGKILLNAGPSYTNAPITFFEFDYLAGTNGAFTQTTSPTGGTNQNISTYPTAMLDLPDGTVLYSCCQSHGTNTLYVYTPGDPPIAAGKPTITSITPNHDGSFTLTGTRLNGISQGAAYGDDLQPYSNYPLVRMTNLANGNVIYARTTNWSSTGVQTGSLPVTVNFTIPASVVGGQYSLVVVANGFASDPVNFYGQAVWVDFNYSAANPQLGTYTNPFSTLAQGTNTVGAGGTVYINSAVQPSTSSEKMTIKKPMTIISTGGPATIGR